MDNLTVCQQCGEKNPDTNLFCGKCAAPLKAKKEKSFRIIQDHGKESLGCFMLVILGVIFLVILILTGVL